MIKSVFTSTLSILCSSVSLFAQVSKTSIVEHFTNTSCSICAANNPSILSNLSANPLVLNIRFHPSSPYSNDFFNQQNKTENDDRTKFYGIYGSTPKVVLNGTSIAYNTLNTALPPLATATSNFKISVQQVKVNADSFNVITIIKKVAADTSKNAFLFVGAIEDTVFQTTNNGETKHLNVFRKSLTKINGNAISLPSAVGDSIVISHFYKANSSWQVRKMHSIGILQYANKTVINSAKSVNTALNLSSIFEIHNTEKAVLAFPNPTNGIITIKENMKSLEVYDYQGKLLKEFKNLTANQAIDISRLNKGIYILINKEMNEQRIQKIDLQ